jgi:hypothetical protein
MATLTQTLRSRFANLRLLYLSSRIYAGYASTALNPEPWAHESAFSVKWLIEAQIQQMAGAGPDPLAGDLDWSGAAPWLGWGPYLWADGLVPRSDGLVWTCSDFQSDGTHPAMTGEHKVGSMLLEFFLDSPFTAPWFRAGAPIPGDLDGDGAVGIGDLLILLAAWGPCDGCPADLDGNGAVGIVDLLLLLASWT